MKKFSIFYFCLFTFALCVSAFAQTLTVREIMREPSIAGMRVESERLSPDGKFVVYLWNAEGKEPKNLYLVSTDGSGTKILVSPKDLLSPNPASTPENKLNYGLIVNDEFAKSRRNQIGNLDWSPDSKRLLFSQNGDLYVLEIDNLTQAENGLTEKTFKMLESAMQRRADLIPNLINAIKNVEIIEQEFFGQIADARSRLLYSLNDAPKGSNQTKSAEQKEKVLQANQSLDKLLMRLESLQENYPQLRSNEPFMNLSDELSGTKNRINVKLSDYNYASKTSKPRRLTKTQSAEFAAQWLDDEKILFSQNGNYFVMDTGNFSLIQISKEANPQAFVSIFSATPTKNGEFVAYVVSDGSKQKTLFVPNYLDEFVQSPTTRRGFSEQKILVAKSDGSLEKPIEIKLLKPEGTGYIRGLDWAADNSSLIVDRIDKDLKRRQIFYIFNVGGKDENTILVTEETDEKWIAPLSRIIEPNPKDSSQILFASEKDGYNHLYLATLDKSKSKDGKANAEIKQLTKGNWQVEWAKWSDENRIIYSSTENSTAEREFYHLLPATGTIFQITSGQKSFKSNPQIAESGGSVTKFIYEVSEWNKPDELYADSSCNVKCERRFPIKLTSTTPENFLKRNWNEPKFIEINSKDNKKIPAKIYLPSDFNKSKKYPMVIFVHGAGYLQNVINGWNNYYREFMFNEMLTQKGYVILDIDYRGSAGYGRDWRTDVYDFLGGLDYQDHLDAIDFMTANYAVNPKKIGVYGGSYGGFMAEMLAFRTDKITCAAALRPVADWKNYFYSSPIYTAERLGFPDKNAAAYKRSSPISYAENLDKPLLILHGLVDDNVPAQDSMQLVEKLIRLEKTEFFDEMIYPAESHSFVRPSSWTDEYTRILMFFERHLK